MSWPYLSRLVWMLANGKEDDVRVYIRDAFISHSAVVNPFDIPIKLFQAVLKASDPRKENVFVIFL